MEVLAVLSLLPGPKVGLCRQLQGVLLQHRFVGLKPRELSLAGVPSGLLQDFASRIRHAKFISFHFISFHFSRSCQVAAADLER